MGHGGCTLGRGQRVHPEVQVLIIARGKGKGKGRSSGDCWMPIPLQSTVEAREIRRRGGTVQYMYRGATHEDTRFILLMLTSTSENCKLPEANPKTHRNRGAVI